MLGRQRTGKGGGCTRGRGRGGAGYGGTGKKIHNSIHTGHVNGMCPGSNGQTPQFPFKDYCFFTIHSAHSILTDAIHRNTHPPHCVQYHVPHSVEHCVVPFTSHICQYYNYSYQISWETNVCYFHRSTSLHNICTQKNITTHAAHPYPAN